MNICFIISPLKASAGGWGRYAQDLMTCAQKSGHTVSTVIIADLNFSLRDVWRIRRASRKADVVFAIDGWPFGVASWLGTRFSKAKLIVGAVGTYTIAPLHNRKSRWLVRKAYTGADSIIAISDYTCDRLLEERPSVNVKVITPGIDLGRWGNVERRNMSRTVISVGALKERKGYHTALEAFAKAKKEIPQLRWVIVGDDSYKEYVQKLRARARELGVANDMRIVGMVSDRELMRLYSEAALFILLSENRDNHFEGFGIVFLEAAATGLPVVGTRGNGIESAVGPDNGILVEQRDSQSAADAIVRILSSEPEWEKMSDASRAWARAHDLAEMCEKLEGVYERLMAPKRSGRT